jgi:hypothetical protein
MSISLWPEKSVACVIKELLRSFKNWSIWARRSTYKLMMNARESHFGAISPVTCKIIEGDFVSPSSLAHSPAVSEVLPPTFEKDETRVTELNKRNKRTPRLDSVSKNK